MGTEGTETPANHRGEAPTTVRNGPPDPMTRYDMTLARGPHSLHTYIRLQGPYMVHTAACIHSMYEEEEGLYAGCRRNTHSHEPNLYQQSMIGQCYCNGARAC